MDRAPGAGRRAAVVIGLACLAMLSSAAAARAQNAPEVHITGRVLTGASRRPIPAVWVIVYESAKIKGRSLTGDDGRYYIGRLAEKAYDLVVMRGRQTLARRQVRLPENTSYDIVIPP